MSQVVAAPTTTAVEVPSIPLGQIAPWALFFGLVATLVLFFVSAEQGAFSLSSGTLVHEFVHDGRHLLGFPCH
ncbi:Probable cobalt transporter subunit (CbtB) [Nocardioides scoriae]|uniref:Probable cobalt transporter subunit (CbtB) n=1 Tax=Nocardioides scoriae TaxID=642780 RepID=A0A1H1P136_9ACTN|nr:CbtB-domain containing protein [Nocardioides scoriae]SDS04893.1 Probable cobalt transporter subunit (CbtB) [Nocardioides scoriae]